MQHQSADTSRKTILVVDDDRDLASILQDALASEYRVVVAGSWATAKAMLTKQHYDLILLDLFLPDAEILEPLRTIRDLDLDYPIIMMSGNVDTQDNIIDRAMRLGVNSIIRKPFDLAGMLERIRQHINE